MFAGADIAWRTSIHLSGNQEENKPGNRDSLHHHHRKTTAVGSTDAVTNGQKINALSVPKF